MRPWIGDYASTMLGHWGTLPPIATFGPRWRSACSIERRDAASSCLASLKRFDFPAMAPMEAPERFCERFAELPPAERRRELVAYFQSALGLMTLQELATTRTAMVALREGPGPCEFIQAIDAHLALRQKRN